MLAKLWKKILLAICIIAILFNITSKLVRRYSLDEQLNSVVGSGSLSEVWSKDSKKDEGNSKQSNNSKNSTNKNTVKNNDSDEDEYYDDEEEYSEDNDSDDEYDNNSNKKNSNNKNSDEKKSNSNSQNNDSDDEEELNVDFGEFDMDEYVNQTQKSYRDLLNDL